MIHIKMLLSFCAVWTTVSTSTLAAGAWVIDTQAEWNAATEKTSDLAIKDGLIKPHDQTATFTSKIRRFDQKQRARSIILEPSPVWQNWKPVPNLGPANLADAPVFLAIGPKNYWVFGRYGGKRKGKKQKPFQAEPATLEGFDIELRTTPWPNQFDAPGGLKTGLGGYHAWQSRDMVHWVHHGPVTDALSKWVTSAEYKDGKVYIYYDYPNDQDPHLYIDDDLTDGKPGKNMGIALRDPSHGSDCGVIRDKQGRFHIIFEDWSPINASKRSWDSPLAGHAVSDSGIDGFEIVAPAVDNRTTDTGKVAEYRHPHWMQHPDWDTNIGKYRVHEPEQEAYGDWAAICVGSQYYLFCDYDPAGGHRMSVGWFTSPDLHERFTWCDQIGNGHPDPDIGFAEGQFYLFTQQKTDYVSPGPWVEKVEVRVGVDVDNDGQLDQWSDWRDVKETYDYHGQLAKHVVRTPASANLEELPAGYGIAFELRMTDTTENKSTPILDRVAIEYD